jgi:hypothetical protein
MRKTFLLSCVLAAAYTGIVNAQPMSQQIEQARIQMLKHTVEFLASDTTAFKIVPNTTCNCRSLDDINNFIKQNNLTNVDSVIMTINKKPDVTVAGWREDLLNFKQSIIDKFISKKGREYRKGLAGYDEFIKKLQASINNIKPSGTDNPQNRSVKKDTSIKNTAQIHNENLQAGISIVSIILSTIIAGLLALCYVLFSRKKNVQKELAMLEKNGQILRAQITDHRNNIENYRIRLLEYEEELQAVKQEKQNLEKLVDGKTREVEQPTPVQHINTHEQKQPDPVKKYARYADAGDGFSDLYLLDQPNSETIFEITVTAPDAATYTVSDNPTVQQYALSNTDYFLRKTCQYDSFPGSNSTIYTREPGQLKKEGGKWAIQTAAKISFN